MKKIQTAQVREDICDSLISCRIILEEQKGYDKWARDTRALLYID